MAFAVIDDLGAIIVIAIFSTASIDYAFLAAALVCFLFLMACNLAGIRHIACYLLLGFVLWLCILQAGIHGTVTGVLIAMAVPARPLHGRSWFVRKTRKLLARLEFLHQKRSDRGIFSDPYQYAVVESVQEMVKSATIPLRRWEGPCSDRYYC